MKTLRLGAVLVSLLILQLFISYVPHLTAQSATVPDVYVGIDMAYGDSVAEAKREIDEVSNFTNLFIIGCTGISNVYTRNETTGRYISENVTKLDETCQYLYDKGLNFIVYKDLPLRNATWTNMANEKWGDHFLGYYAFDELGGWQIDMHEWSMVQQAPTDYSGAATAFVNMSKYYLDRFTRFRNTTRFNLYLSDYALYWFDYETGYDTVFAEFALNYNRQLNIALCRGAANLHGKDWGVTITWKYKTEPYLESGAELYDDLLLAYENGAKYIILFDANEGWTQSVLKPEHLDALKRFWAYLKEHPRQNSQTNDRVAYVLPKDYGYGFRGPDDKIWGFWGPDNLTNTICYQLSNLFTQYGKKLDIIYDDGLQPGNNYGYSKLIYWNDSSLAQPASTASTPTQSLWSSPVETQPSTSNPVENFSPPLDYSLIAIALGVVAVVSVPVVMLRKKQHCITFAQTGVGRDFTGTVVVVDGVNYDRYGASFWWDHGSRHTFEFKSPLMVNGAKQYVLISTNGMHTHEDDVIKASMETTVTGNYTAVFKARASPSRNRP